MSIGCFILIKKPKSREINAKTTAEAYTWLQNPGMFHVEHTGPETNFAGQGQI